MQPSPQWRQQRIAFTLNGSAHGKRDRKVHRKNKRQREKIWRLDGQQRMKKGAG
jgi:hypothetical protein